MADNSLPPAPIRDPWGSYTWEEWFRRLRDRALTSLTSVLWTGIDFTSSSITNILDRKHNDLQTIQGGTSAEYYHLKSSEYTELQRSDNVATTAVDLTLDDTYQTVTVTATAKTITLPACSTARIGKVWTVIQDTVGYVDIVRAGSDTIILPTVDTTIRTTTKGATVSLKCLSASTWGLI
jgi:hypothetical protein